MGFPIPGAGIQQAMLYRKEDRFVCVQVCVDSRLRFSSFWDTWLCSGISWRCWIIVKPEIRIVFLFHKEGLTGLGCH